jgi:hypothetical protein
VAGEDRYRLTPVRDARARDERVKRGDLAAAASDARETQGRLDAARARVTAARDALAKAIANRLTLGTGAQLALAETYIARRRHELEAAIGEELRVEAAHEKRLGELDLARRTLARARAEREVIERHFRRWRDERQRLASRRED